LPDGFKVKYSAQKELLYDQELCQKLEGIGYQNPVIFNAPKLSSESNEAQLNDALRNQFVTWGLVQPGRHSIIIRLANNGKDSQYVYKNVIVQSNN